MRDFAKILDLDPEDGHPVLDGIGGLTSSEALRYKYLLDDHPGLTEAEAERFRVLLDTQRAFKLSDERDEVTHGPGASKMRFEYLQLGAKDVQGRVDALHARLARLNAKFDSMEHGSAERQQLYQEVLAFVAAKKKGEYSTGGQFGGSGLKHADDHEQSRSLETDKM
ncbi:hypothetical protein FA95DRAFT_1573760 [Auriscalpium vulgare]|uniref:Uncharacterized protein n=1 Tax=Auriscalpium vulgare TaxID=40419 RepID=A0ACB8RPH8_9AGAM|nr:hypothetical protein FA95DRAFT_1573760 [Auriscalpium vulgare]